MVEDDKRLKREDQQSAFPLDAVHISVIVKVFGYSPRMLRLLREQGYFNIWNRGNASFISLAEFRSWYEDSNRIRIRDRRKRPPYNEEILREHIIPPDANTLAEIAAEIGYSERQLRGLAAAGIFPSRSFGATAFAQVEEVRLGIASNPNNKHNPHKKRT